MMDLRARLTYSNVIASLALFVAIGGGAYAAVNLPAKSVGARQLRNGAVTSRKVRDRSLLRRDIKAGQVLAPASARRQFLAKNARAADAARLGGFPVTSFAGGPGRLVSVRKDAGGAGSATLLDSPKLGRVLASCLNPPSAGGSVNYQNTSSTGTEAMLDEQGGLQATIVDPTGALDGSLTMPNHETVELWKPDGSASALLEIASFVADGKCVWETMGIVRG